MSQDFTVNSQQLVYAYQEWVQKQFDEHKFLTFPPPRIGPDRSMSQNSLLHLWCTEYAAHLLSINKNQVTPGILEGMKRKIKQAYYQETAAPWMIHEIVNPFNPEQRRRDFTSSAGWRRGEMKSVLDWMQYKAAGDGLVLESRGEHAKLTREENGQQ